MKRAYWVHASLIIGLAAGTTGPGVAVAAGRTLAAPRSATSFEGGRPQLAQDTVRIPYDSLVADVGQLVDFLELTHPDPYGSAGKIAFQRRVHVLLREIPDSGLTRAEFHGLLEPLLASVGDGHTRVERWQAEESSGSGPGVPIELRVIAAGVDAPEPALFVQSVNGSQVDLRGARLEAISGIPLATLIERERTWSPYENDFGNLDNIVDQLSTSKGLGDLVPEWPGGDSVAVAVTMPDGDERTLRLALGAQPSASSKTSTAVRIPETRGGVPAWEFVDDRRETALLRLDNTWAHREVFESILKRHQASPPFDLRLAGRVYQLWTGKEPPEDTAEVVNGLPAATQILGDLVESMRDAGTKRLIVDVRNNSGGHSMLVDMLLYYLYGRRGWLDFYGNFHTIRRLTPDDGPSGRFPGRVGDYDFSSEFKAATQTPEEAGSEGYWKATTISFAKVLESNRYEAYYAPPEVIVLVSPTTFSGGFWVAAALRRMGARLIGVSPGQAGNAFANVKYITLDHSGIKAGVSSRLFMIFPEKGVSYPVLPVDVPLTYERWAATGFDANGEIMLALGMAR